MKSITFACTRETLTQPKLSHKSGWRKTEQQVGGNGGLVQKGSAEGVAAREHATTQCCDAGHAAELQLCKLATWHLGNLTI